MNKGDEVLFLISHLLRALSHKIRTPLSVIGNDLYYIGTHVSPSETTRAQEKVREIADALTELVHPVSIDQKIDRCTLGELIPHQLRTDGKWSRLIVSVNSNALKCAFALLQQLVEFSVIGGAQLGEVVTLEVIGRVKGDGEKGDFSLFTQLFNENLGLQSPIPPVLDALFSASSVQVHGSVAGQEFSLQLQFRA